MAAGVLLVVANLLCQSGNGDHNQPGCRSGVRHRRAFQPRDRFISVLLGLAPPVILNVPQDNETSAGLRDVLSVMTELGAKPWKRPPGAGPFSLLPGPPARLQLPYPGSDLSGRRARVSSMSFSLVAPKLGIPPLAFVW